MRETLKNIWKLIGVAGILSCILHGCIDDNAGYKTDSEETGVTLSFSLPAPAAGEALLQTDEHEIKTIDVLVFEAGGDFLYSSAGTLDLTHPGTNLTTKYFSTNLKKATAVDLIILINGRDELIAAGLSENDNRATVLSSLVVNLTSGNAWNTDVSDPGYREIPMAGAILNQPITQDTGPRDAPLTATVVRMLAKVDIVLTDALHDSGNGWTMHQVYYYSGNYAGNIFPEESSYTWGTDVTTPTVPVGVKEDRGTPYVYNTSGAYNPQGCADQIYIFESLAGGRNNEAWNSYPCLVVAVSHNDDPGNIRYFRADFAETSGSNKTYLDILRNHHYVFTITQIEGEGFETPEEARDYIYAGFTAEITVWEKGYATDLELFQYYLYIPETYIYFDKNWAVKSYNFYGMMGGDVRTNHPDGLKSKISSSPTDPDAGWNPPDWYNGTYVDLGELTSGMLEGVTFSSSSVINNVNVEGNETVHTYIHISAGNLTNVVHIEDYVAWYYFWSDMDPSVIIPARGDGFTYNVWCKTNITEDNTGNSPRFSAGYSENSRFSATRRGGVCMMEYTHTENDYIDHYKGSVEILNYGSELGGGIYGPAEVIKLYGKLKGQEVKENYSVIESPDFGGATVAKQAYGNYHHKWVYGEVFIAMEDIGPMTWAEAMGISTSYNSSSLYTSYNTWEQTAGDPGTRYFPNQNYWYTTCIDRNKMLPTGCLNYTEKANGSDRGEWFLPSGYIIWWGNRYNPSSPDYYPHPQPWDTSIPENNQDGWTILKASVTGGSAGYTGTRIFWFDEHIGRDVWVSMEHPTTTNQAHFTTVSLQDDPDNPARQIFNATYKTNSKYARCVKDASGYYDSKDDDPEWDI